MSEKMETFKRLDEIFGIGAEGDETMEKDPERILDKMRRRLRVNVGDEDVGEDLLSECERRWVSFAAVLAMPTRRGMPVIFGKSGAAKTTIAQWSVSTVSGAVPTTRRPGRTTQSMFRAFDGKKAAVADDLQVGREETVRDLIRALASREAAGSRQYGMDNPPRFVAGTVQTDDHGAQLKTWTRDLSNVTTPVVIGNLPKVPGKVASMFRDLAERPPSQRPDWDRVDTHPTDKWFSLAETTWRLTADTLGDDVKVEPATSAKPEAARPLATAYRRTHRLPVTPNMICSNPEVPRVTAERVSELGRIIYRAVDRFLSTGTATGALNVRSLVYFVDELWLQLATCAEFEKSGGKAVREVFRGMKQLQLRGTVVHRRLRDLKTELREFAEATLAELEKIKF